MRKDILILGGGPAGLSTALHVARIAPDLVPRLLLLEKASYPRPKLCGGALLADAEVILQRLGLDVREIAHVDVSRALLDFEGVGLTYTVPGTHALRMIRRDQFDAWLAAKTRLSGIEIREGVNVRRVEARAEAVTVVTDAGDFEAAIVVGADGSNGVTRRCVRPSNAVRTARLLEVLARVIDEAGRDRSRLKNNRPIETTLRSAPPENVHDGDSAYFDFFPVPRGIAGYTWDFPTQVNGRPMHCWGIYDTNLLADLPRPPLKAPLAEEMARHGFTLADHELQGHPIRLFSPFTRFSVPRVILVGDAAGVDAIFGEGISIALGYGCLAAEAIRDACASADFSFGGYRRRILLSPLGQVLSVRAGIALLLYHLHWAWFQRLFWNIFKPVVAIAARVLVLNWAKRSRWAGRSLAAKA